MRDAERFQIGDDGSSRVEIEIRGELHAVGCDRNGGRHYRASRRQNTDHGGTSPLVASPQIGVPVVSLCLWAIPSVDRLARRWGVAPSPTPQVAVSNPS